MSWIMSQDGKTIVNLEQCASITVIGDGTRDSKVIAQPENIVIYSGSHQHCEDVYKELVKALKTSKINTYKDNSMRISWFEEK